MSKEILEKRLEEFFKSYNTISYQKNEIILRAEDIPQGVYYLKSGFVRLYTLSIDGKELNLTIFKPGSYFSLLWALFDLQNDYYFQTMSSVEVIRAPKDHFQSFLNVNKDIQDDLNRIVMSGYKNMMNRVERLIFDDASTKVASILLISARKFGNLHDTSDTIINVPLTHQEIANFAGLTRETTSIEMKKLEKSGHISKKHRTLVIHDMKRLEHGLDAEISTETFPYIL